MTTQRSVSVQALLEDARKLYDDAIEQLEQGKLPNAADKAWGATRQAATAVVLARGRGLPESYNAIKIGLHSLASEDRTIQDVERRFRVNVEDLHGECFYDGDCEPESYYEQLVRETKDLIDDAEKATRGYEAKTAVRRRISAEGGP